MVTQVGGRTFAGVAGVEVSPLEAASQDVDEAAAAPPVRTWLLVYVRAGKRLPWLKVRDVPVEAKQAEVLAALETWRKWSAYAPGPGRTTLVRIERAGRLDGALDGCFSVSWAVDLKPETVKTSVELPGEVHARIVLAARQRGMTQAAWMAEQLALAVTGALGGAA